MAGENINRQLNIYINGKEVVNSLSGITREMGKTRNELKNLNKNSIDYDKDVTRLTKHLADLNERQGEFRDELKLTNKEMSAAQDNFSDLLGGLAVGDMKAVQEGLMGIRGSIVASSQAAWAFVATPVGAFIATFVGLGLAAKQVYDFNESIKESNQLLDNLGVDRNLRPAIQAIADTYEVGFESLASAIDNMVDLGLVKDEFEALDKIKEGLVKAPDKNGFLAMLDANGVAAKNLDLQLEDVISLNESFEASGANAVAIFGALQKSSSTLILQSPQLKKSLENAFGAAFTKDLLGQVKSGTITYYDALDRIYKKGEELGISNQKQAQLAKDLFGKSAIAAGGYEMILGNVTAAQSKQTEALTETQIETQKLAESNIELAKAQDLALKLDGYNRWKNNALLALNWVKTAWYDMLSGVMNSQEDMINASKKAGAENRIKDEAKNFNDYMENRKKRLGEAFDWEKERAEHLADVMKRMNSGWNTDVEQKSFDLQITTIKNAKNPNAKKQTPDGLSDEDKKSGESAAKKREKELADAKKHSEDLLKQLEASKKELLATERSFDDLKLANQKDGYAKELALLNEEYSRKIEDTKSKVSQLQEEINKLNADVKNPKNSKDDIAILKATIANKIAAQIDYNTSLVDIEQSRILKVATLQEKYLQKDIQEQEQANARALQNIQTRHNNELSSITTLENAKALLSTYLTAEQLKEVHNLEEAKKKLKQQFQNEELTLQQKHLVEMMAQIQAVFEQENLQGIELITPEQRELLLKFLDDAAAKLAALGVSKKENNPDKVDDSKDIKSLSGLDILGFTPEQWQNTFDSLDEFTEKIAAVEMVIGAVKNAFGMYFQFLEAGEKRTMQKFEANNRKKQSDLNDQLEKGYITQEVYTARKAKLETELAKKKAEIEYKQAKREKMMNIASIIANTAVGVSKALAQGGMIFGVPFAGIIAALGGLQLIAAIAQPLPDKNGFYDGGYTGSGPERNSPGPVHYEEYVVPKKVLFSNDPIVPNIVGYLEAKRTGKNPQMPQEEQANTPMNQSGSSSSQETTALAVLVSRAVVVLEKIEEDGVVAYLENNIKTAKKMRDKIKEVNKLETNAKA
jgi:uncharacterized small protein (DUF1192 family)